MLWDNNESEEYDDEFYMFTRPPVKLTFLTSTKRQWRQQQKNKAHLFQVPSKAGSVVLRRGEYPFERRRCKQQL